MKTNDIMIFDSNDIMIFDPNEIDQSRLLNLMHRHTLFKIPY
jgi:hypothetical protein